MRPAAVLSGCLLAVALATGTLSDGVQPNPPLMLGGYRVLAADFHVHTYPLSASTLAPWDLVLEARRQGLDALAISGHNEVRSGLVGRWFSRLVGGPTVLPSEEIHSAFYHMIAVGIHQTISWRQPAARAVEEVHRQGGVAIAAHPMAAAWPAFEGEAMRTLDGAEVMQPVVYGYWPAGRELRQFYQRGTFAAIGSSDHHGLGPLGLFRTYVFARDDSEAAILEALRAHRTVVYGIDGAAYGDAQCIHLAAEHGGVRAAEAVVAAAHAGWPALASRICGIAGLLVAVWCGFGGVYSAEVEEKPQKCDES